MDFSNFTSKGGVNAEGSIVGFSITLAGLAFEVFSAHCSSPWTSETFGGDPAKARSTMKYVWRSVAITEVLGVGGVLLAHNVMPFLATSVVSIYMVWTYVRAMRHAVSQGSDGASWSSGGGSRKGMIGVGSIYGSQTAGP